MSATPDPVPGEGLKWRVLRDTQDVSDHALQLAVDCVEWFLDGPLATEDFIDRLSNDYLNPERMEIEDYDCPAVRKIMRHARQARREMI